VKYCTRCLMPNTKPYISFDDLGVCNACLAHNRKNTASEGIDWSARATEFEKLIAWAKGQRAPFYDALVPVSGGKDSITQVHRLLGHDLRILAVNVDYGVKTEIGRRNLDCIAEMGANLIIFRPEMGVHRKLIQIGLEDFGDPDLLSHTLLHAYPLHVALRFGIPLVALGENSAFEYGGETGLSERSSISRSWFDIYAANSGNTAKKIGDAYKLPLEPLWQYDYPDELDRSSKTKAVFLSYFYHWSSEEHLKIAKGYGFRELSEPTEGTYRTYVGIDEMINRIHQYQKVLKFGYGRATDHACEDIRNGLLDREEAKRLIKKYDFQPLGKEYVSEVSEFLGYTKTEFKNIVDSSRNQSLWKQNDVGDWFIPGYLEE
jgi:N-acetyl sugar amidotransferase